jgi:beta-1,4-mannosyltransferase
MTIPVLAESQAVSAEGSEALAQPFLEDVAEAYRAEVCFIPFFETNPYQRQLAANLRFLGFNVTPRAQLKGLIVDILRGRNKARIIHLHWLPALPGGAKGFIRLLAYCARLLMLRLLGRKIVWTVHNLYNHEVQNRRLERWLTRIVTAAAARILVHSPTAHTLVVKEFQVRHPEKVSVVPHGNYVRAYPNSISQAEARQRLGLDPKRAVILFFGNIRPYKGVLHLLEAYEKLGAGDSTLVIAGKPSWDVAAAATFQQVVARNKDVAVRAGFVPDEEVQVYLNACDVVVFPYQEILTSGAVIRAMSFGKACIAPRRGCIPDVLDDAGAFLYDSNKPEGLKTALAAALRERSRLTDMGAHNLNQCRQWDWDSVAQRTATQYSAALDNSRD